MGQPRPAGVYMAVFRLSGQDIDVHSSYVKFLCWGSIVCCGQLRTCKALELDGNWSMPLKRQSLKEQAPQIQSVSLIIPLLIWSFYGGTKLAHALDAFPGWKLKNLLMVTFYFTSAQIL